MLDHLLSRSKVQPKPTIPSTHHVHGMKMLAKLPRPIFKFAGKLRKDFNFSFVSSEFRWAIFHAPTNKQFLNCSYAARPKYRNHGNASHYLFCQRCTKAVLPAATPDNATDFFGFECLGFFLCVMLIPPIMGISASYFAFCCATRHLNFVRSRGIDARTVPSVFCMVSTRTALCAPSRRTV